VSAQQAAIVALESDVAALESDVVELEQFKSNSLCFIGHMTDDQFWSSSSGLYREQKAYEDCF